MSAAEQLTKMYAEYLDMLQQVRAQYTNLQQCSLLAKRHGITSIEDAMDEEAKQSLRRNTWARVAG